MCAQSLTVANAEYCQINDMRQLTKEAIKVNLRSFAVAAIIDLTLIGVIVFFEINLLDVKLIVSLAVLEIPTAAFLNYLFGERRKAEIEGAVEYLRAAKEFSHLLAYRFYVFSLFPLLFRVKFYVVENTKTNHAYIAPPSIETLAENGIIRLNKERKKEKALLAYLKTRSVIFDEREALPKELE